MVPFPVIKGHHVESSFEQNLFWQTSQHKNQVNLPYRPAIQCQHPLSRLCRPWWTCHGGWSIEHKCYVTNKLWLNFLDSPSASLKQTDKKQQIDNNKQANLQQTTHTKKTVRQTKNKVISNNKQTNSKQTSYKQTTNKQKTNNQTTKRNKQTINKQTNYGWPSSTPPLPPRSSSSRSECATTPQSREPPEQKKSYFFLSSYLSFVVFSPCSFAVFPDPETSNWTDSTEVV